MVLSEGDWGIVGATLPGSMGTGLGNWLMEGVGLVCVVGSPVHVQLDLCSLGVLYFISLMLWGALVGVLVDDPIDHA